ncbi:MAG: Rrf2 family transcriptional regulator [Acidobacteria bacterium]|nr:Rrf2 family transcriptional regulator [Acidobacteriota bacterium]
MLTISREADYATRLIVHMAVSTPQRLQAKTLAEAERIPESFLFKILQLLMRHRLVRSYRGVYGGYQLAMDPAKLTLYRLLEIVEGPIGLNVCVASGIGCELSAGCGVHDVWVVAQAQLRQTLESVTVAELAQRTLEKRRILAARTGDSGRLQRQEGARP